MLDASVPCQPGIWVTNPTHNIACNTLTYVFAPLGFPARTNLCQPQHLLAVLADPTHPEHAEQIEWLGLEYDPDEFTMESADARLAARFNASGS